MTSKNYELAMGTAAELGDYEGGPDAWCAQRVNEIDYFVGEWVGGSVVPPSHPVMAWPDAIAERAGLPNRGRTATAARLIARGIKP